MNKLITKLLAGMVFVSICTSPAFAQKRSEYNFNTCNYNFYGNANPMNGQGAAGAPVSFYKGVGQTASNAESMRTGMNASVYQQTPQRTKVWDQMGYNRKKVNTYRPQQQLQQQQPLGYAYVPGQNGKAAQNQTSSSVSYQINTSGLATYDSANTATSTTTKQQP